MKLYLQDRKALLELPADIWIAEVCDRGLIVSNNRVRPYIAEYASVARAQDVMREIHEYYRDGKNSYTLPLE